MKKFKVAYFNSFLTYPILRETGNIDGNYIEVVTTMNDRECTTWVHKSQIV